jgi:hypothetical protein
MYTIKTEELLEAVFSKQSMPRLYNENWSRVVRPLLLQKGRPHFKTRKSLEKKNMVMGPDRTGHQELLCW